MPARARRSSHVGRGPRRKLVWATADNVLAVPAGGLANLDLLAALEVAGSSLLGITVIRTHLKLRVPFVGLNDAATFGLIVGRKADLGAGLGANPGSAPEDDWMWLQRVWATATGATIDTDREVTVDSHAKRKMDELQMSYYLAWANGNAAAANIGIYARTLIALP